MQGMRIGLAPNAAHGAGNIRLRGLAPNAAHGAGNIRPASRSQLRMHTQGHPCPARNGSRSLTGPVAKRTRCGNRRDGRLGYHRLHRGFGLPAPA